MQSEEDGRKLDHSIKLLCFREKKVSGSEGELTIDSIESENENESENWPHDPGDMLYEVLQGR